MVKIVTSDGKVLHTKDVVKHLIFNIGEDIEGNFYPNHLDFYICFGTWHTEKGAIYIASVVTILFIIDIATAIFTQLWYILPFVLLIIPIEIAMIYGIKKEKEKLILPHLIMTILTVLIGFIVLIFVCITVITPHVFFYNMITTMFMTTNYKSLQLVSLLYALALCITMSLLFWINWSLYIHYRYLKGLKAFRKQSKHLIFNIGEDIEGNFYPKHLDFYICFGTWHTEKGAIYIAVFVTIVFIIDIIIAIITHMWYFLPFIAILLPIEFIMAYGIKKEKEKFILPHLIASILLVLMGFIILILICIALITPNIFFYGMIKTMFMSTNKENVQLVLLLYALTICFTMSLLFWINWSLYIHYRYLKGLKNFIKKSKKSVINEYVI